MKNNSWGKAAKTTSQAGHCSDGGLVAHVESESGLKKVRNRWKGNMNVEGMKLSDLWKKSLNLIVENC